MKEGKRRGRQIRRAREDRRVGKGNRRRERGKRISQARAILRKMSARW